MTRTMKSRLVGAVPKQVLKQFETLILVPKPISPKPKRGLGVQGSGRFSGFRDHGLKGMATPSLVLNPQKPIQIRQAATKLTVRPTMPLQCSRSAKGGNPYIPRPASSNTSPYTTPVQV